MNVYIITNERQDISQVLLNYPNYVNLEAYGWYNHSVNKEIEHSSSTYYYSYIISSSYSLERNMFLEK